MTPRPCPAQQLVWAAELVVLDFDGPITRLLPGEMFLEVTAGAKEQLMQHGLRLDETLHQHTDHVQLLRSIDQRSAAIAAQVERWCTEQEVAAAAQAQPVPAAAQFVAECSRQGIPVAVVTNNAPTAVDAVLQRGGPVLGGVPVHGRDPDHLDRLKPAPAMLLAAAAEARVDPAAAVMVGDTVSDVLAATRAGMRCLGLSQDPARRADLRRAGAAATASTLADLLPASGTERV